MSPSFQLTLYLSIIGLGFATPSSRSVSWCVTSDLEQKKCNELAATCNVPDVSLVCVHRSSTEDCKSSIRDGQADAIFLDAGEVFSASLNYNLKPIIAEPYNTQKELKKCQKEKQKTEEGEKPMRGAFIPQCDEKGDYEPQQCHSSTGYCWCVNANGEEIPGTKTPPEKPRASCGEDKSPKCQRERQKLIKANTHLGHFIPQCEENGNYKPQQCHGSTGSCWCVNADGNEIRSTRTGPGKPKYPCLNHDLPDCQKERQKAEKASQSRPGIFIPECNKKGDFKPLQCHNSSGHCWRVDRYGFEIAGTPRGHQKASPDEHDSETSHYAVAVVKSSSAFNFNELKGKKSCHSGKLKEDGWYAPLNVLVAKKMLPWEGPAKESTEKAISRFFSGSCIPGANEPNLCSQCAGEDGKRCKSSHDEPYYGSDGALRCLKDDMGDVAFTKNTALSDVDSEIYQLLCPDNNRRPLKQYKNCNLGRLPAEAVVTRDAGDKTEDITYFLMEAQKNQCKLFDSSHGKDLMFEDSITSLTSLPSGTDAYLFLGDKQYHTMKALEVQPRSNDTLRWCPIGKQEKEKCDNWSAVSGGAISCAEASSTEECVKRILKGEVDAVALEIHQAYTALKCGLEPAMEEFYNTQYPGPCQVRGSQITDFVTEFNVALVKKSNTDINWKNLRGKKACHPGNDHANEWRAAVTYIGWQQDSSDIGSFFGESCVPGSDPKSSLCKLCSGDTTNVNTNKKCLLSAEEKYYGLIGSFRCLVEKGDVAFVHHRTVFENTDGKNTADWAKNLKSSDYELLCPDGSRAPVTSYRNCKLHGIAPRVIVSRPEAASDVSRILINQESLYGRNAFQKDIFQMFSSKSGKNLLFNDNTLCLIEFDRQPTGIMNDLFFKDYVDSPHIPNKFFPPSELTSICTSQLG